MTIEMVGRKFNKLLVLERAIDPRYKHASWLCKCDCGNLVTVVGNNLRNGGTKSCGCSKGEYIRAALSKLPSQYPDEYSSYNAMLFRCFNPNSSQYRYYGGRGITVCQRWLGDDGFKNFLADMGLRPAGMSLDRYPDYNDDYKPNNCRWATDTEQNRNRSNNVVITYRNASILMVDWAYAFDINRRKLRDYLKYCSNFEEFLIRHKLIDRANQILNDPYPIIIQPYGKFKEFDGYS
jgi:hypothetical protein